jgi:hypothetical protein
MKLKLRHLRYFLNTLDVPTATCKDKRDLAELVIKNRIKIPKMQTQNSPQQQQEQHDNNQQQQQQHSHTTFNQQNSNPNSFNDRFSGFMNNVQDFVNFNLNSVLTNPPVPCPAPGPASQPTTSSQYNGHSSQAQGNSNSSKQPTANTTYTTNTSSSSSSLPTNLNSVFSFIGEQLPNVINNNLFTFNTNNITTSGI